jgi:hypothetical protein
MAAVVNGGECDDFGDGGELVVNVRIGAIVVNVGLLIVMN